jgi:hypothetical protein
MDMGKGQVTDDHVGLKGIRSGSFCTSSCAECNWIPENLALAWEFITEDVTMLSK